MDVYRFKLPLIVSILICSNAFAQTKKSFDFNQPITIPGNSVRLDSLLKNISRQTGFIFSYNTRKINHGLRFSFSNKRYPLVELLTKIKEKTGLDYSIADNHIILKSARLIASPLKIQAVPTLTKETKKENTTTPQVKSKSNVIPDSIKVDVVKKSEPPANISNDIPEKSAEKIPQTLSDDQKKVAEPLPKIQVEQSKPASTQVQRLKKDSIVKVNNIKSKPASQIKNKNQLPLQLKAGLSADETIYLGPALQFGIPLIYGTASYKTDFKIGLLSWGLGTSFKLGKTLKLSLQINTGTVSKHYDSTVLSAYDSSSIAQRGVIAKSNLTRIAFLIEKNLTPRLIIQGGLHYNLLTTKYSAILVSESSNKPCAISPPYLLTNSTNSRGDANVKSWIGLQVNLLYTINFSKKK